MCPKSFLACPGHPKVAFQSAGAATIPPTRAAAPTKAIATRSADLTTVDNLSSDDDPRRLAQLVVEQHRRREG
jgi:hypothetical protein